MFTEETGVGNPTLVVYTNYRNHSKILVRCNSLEDILKRDSHNTVWIGDIYR